MDLLTQLQTWLAALGPYGIVAGGVLTIVVQRIRARIAQPKPGPVDPSNPAPAPAPAPSSTPILDWFLTKLRDRLTKRQGFESVGPVQGDDMDPVDAMKLLAALDKKE